MEGKHFERPYINYGKRFWEGFLPQLIVVIAILFFSFFASKQGNLVNSLLLMIVFAVVTGIIQLHIAKSFIKEVKFHKDHILIRGYDFNTPWEAVLKTQHCRIEIKSRGRGRGNVEYFLRLRSNEGHCIDINPSFNWNYQTLLAIFYEFKAIKEEKIIFDEKYFLDIMEKKSQGKSSLSISLGQGDQKAE